MKSVLRTLNLLTCKKRIDWDSETIFDHYSFPEKNTIILFIIKCAYNCELELNLSEIVIQTNVVKNGIFSCDFRLPPRCILDLRSSGILRNVANPVPTFRDNLSVSSSGVEQSKKKIFFFDL